MTRYKCTQIALGELPEVLRREVWNFVLPRRRWVWKLLMSRIIRDVFRDDPILSIRPIPRSQFLFRVVSVFGRTTTVACVRWRPPEWSIPFMCDCPNCVKAAVTLEEEEEFRLRVSRYL